MKKFGLTLSVILALGVNAMAHGCWGVCGFWPSFSIGIGLGSVFGCSLCACTGCCCYCGCGYPAYRGAYPQPAYAYAPPAGYADPPAAFPSAVRVPEPSYWVPSTPGAGRWVPDPAPYSYTSPVSATRPADAPTALRQVVTMTHSAEGIPVYSISYLK